MSIIDRVKASGITVGILCGGPGAEREVSLHSGSVVYSALHRSGLPCEEVIVPESGAELFLESIQHRLVVVMLHGEWGEDGQAQTILERRGIAYTGSDAAVSALAMDKDRCKRLFRKHDIPTPRWTTAADHRGLEPLVDAFTFPLFVKPNRRGSSVGVSRVNTMDELPQAVEKALREDDSALIEELVRGRELTVGWLGGEVLPIVEMGVDGTFYDYQAKYLSSATRYTCPAELVPCQETEINEYAERIAGIIGVRDMARIDLMLGADGPQFLEVNTLPGFTSHSLMPMAACAAGIDIEQLCLRLVEMAAARAGMV